MAHEDRIILAITRMKAKGDTNAEIGRAVGLSTQSVKSICNQRGIKKLGQCMLRLSVKQRIKARLQEEAFRRKIPMNALIRHLLGKVTHDQLYSAILDDSK